MFRSFILFAGLVLALGLAGCPQQAEETTGDAEVVVEEVQDAAGDTAEMVEEVVEEPAAEEPAADEPAADDSGSDAGDDTSH